MEKGLSESSFIDPNQQQEKEQWKEYFHCRLYDFLTLAHVWVVVGGHCSSLFFSHSFLILIFIIIEERKNLTCNIAKKDRVKFKNKVSIKRHIQITSSSSGLSLDYLYKRNNSSIYKFGYCTWEFAVISNTLSLYTTLLFHFRWRQQQTKLTELLRNRFYYTRIHKRSLSLLLLLFLLRLLPS